MDELETGNEMSLGMGPWNDWDKHGTVHGNRPGDGRRTGDRHGRG